ncbi:glycosyltransferase family 9 protein [Helicobacter sp. MIT 01-3238]|uniref:glycosyltransferase family 9 protein n=1 Tax=Helicobacter sp. MIT 01-3238 TaxID=398627 RepID=UPI000E1EC19E|nr:glycosyltransferase family 9 protein [Helicobacter sp. MIT 01-3238]RDU53403.1 hypothetical protein CQA40_05480 [Helicobacter sp. MIT 01-3238]
MSEKRQSTMSPTMPSKLTLGFLHHYGLGDNLMLLKSLYLAKRAYNCRLIIFGNALFKQILNFVDFLDSTDLVVDISHLCEESLPIVAYHKCDYFILTNPKAHYIRLLSKLDTPIITPLKFPSLFCAKAKCPPLAFFLLYRKLRADNALCALVRIVDKKAFDSFVANSIDRAQNLADLASNDLADNNFANSDLASASWQMFNLAHPNPCALAGGGQHYKQKSRCIIDFERKMEQLDTIIKDEIKLKAPNPKIAQSFLRERVENYIKDLQNKTLQINTPTNPTCTKLPHITHNLPHPFIICINPFSNAATHTLPLEAFLELISKVLALPNVCVLLITFPSVHNEFMSQVQSHRELQAQKSKLFIYQNDNTLSNLIALLGFQSLLISPSTGTIHLASNLGIKTIGLYSRKDTTRWATQDKLYTIIPKEKSLLTQKHCAKIIDKTLSQIQSLIDSNALKPF